MLSLDGDGKLPHGIHTVSFAQVKAQFGSGSLERKQQTHLLGLIINTAKAYPLMKRVLLWGSYVTNTSVPNDLDYSVVMSAAQRLSDIAPEHRRFFLPSEARLYYGVDAGYVALFDFPLERYVERMDFICHGRDGKARGIVEINLRGEVLAGGDDDSQ